jgi:hypothetical protein
MISILESEVEGLKRQLAQEYAHEQELAAMLENARANRLRLEGVVLYLEEKAKAVQPPEQRQDKEAA